MLVLSVCCLGAARGAEGDVVAYLVSKRFDLNLYSTVLSLLMASIGVSSAVGALIHGRMLRESIAQSVPVRSKGRLMGTDQRAFDR